MKVTFTKEAKNYITVAEAEHAKQIIQEMKEDTNSASEYLAMAARAIFHTNGIKVIESSASIAGNCRTWDSYHTGSGKLDIWIEGLVKADLDKYAEIGCYLTDIWTIDGTAENRETIREHAYIEEYNRTA